MLMMILLTLLISFVTIDAYQPYFDDNRYYAYPKDDSLEAYAYDSSRVCKIRRIGSGYYANLENAYSIIEKSPLQGLNVIDERQTCIFLACFKYKEFSYILYKYNANNLIYVMRGHLTMTFRLPIELEKICYDQVQSTAYALSVNSHLYSMNLEALQTYWRNNNEEGGKKREEENETTLWSSVFAETGIFWDNTPINDMIIVNNTVYYYENSQLYLYKTEIATPSSNFYRTTIVPIHSTTPKFSYILFENPSNMNIPLPSGVISNDDDVMQQYRTEKDDEKDAAKEMIWKILLYTLDVLFIFAAFCLLRLLYNNGNGRISLPKIMLSKSLSSKPFTIERPIINMQEFLKGEENRLNKNDDSDPRMKNNVKIFI